MPGGHIHDDEPIVEGLRREIREEAGLSDVVLNGELFTRDLKLGNTLRAVVFFSAVAESTDVKLSEEHTDYKWITANEIDDYNLGVFAPVIKEIIEEEFPIDPCSLALYKWIDKQDESKERVQDIGKFIEESLYEDLWDTVDDLLDNIENNDTLEDVVNNVHETLEKWLDDKRPEIDEAFTKLFERGFNAGAKSTGVEAKREAAKDVAETDAKLDAAKKPAAMATIARDLQIEDKNTMSVIQQGKYRIGERITELTDELTGELADIVSQHFTETGMVSLEEMTEQMRQIVPDSRHKLVRIARTEVSNVTQIGRILAWNDDPDVHYYYYFWRSTPDTKRRRMKQIRSNGNPYSYDEIKFLWTHNWQLLPSGKWEMGAINCRCTVTRSPSDDEFQGNRFEGQENGYRMTMEVDF